MTGAIWLAASAPEGAGGWALLLVVLLGLATVLLYRSMTKHLRKVPTSFDPPVDPPADH